MSKMKEALVREAVRRQPPSAPAFESLRQRSARRIARRRAAVAAAATAMVGAFALGTWTVAGERTSPNTLSPAPPTSERIVYQLSYEDEAAYLAQGDGPVEDCVRSTRALIDLSGEALPGVQRVSIEATSEYVDVFEECLSEVPGLTATRMAATPEASAG